MVWKGVNAWRGKWGGYAVSLLFTLIIVALKGGLLALFGETTPYVLLNVAVLLSAWFAGVGPAVLTLVLTIAAAEFVFHPYRLEITATSIVGSHFAYLVQGSLVIWFISSIHVARRRLEISNRRLQRDVEARSKVEAELRSNQTDLDVALQTLTSHFENTPLAVVEYDTNFRITRWNSRCEEIFGWKASEVIGEKLNEWNWIYADDAEDVNKRIHSLLTGTTRVTSFNRNYRKDGKVVHMEWYNSAIYDASGRMSSLFSIGLDVTERVATEASLREQEVALRDMNERLENRVQERTSDLNKAVETLERLNHELHAKNRALEEFAQVTSHDLQEPLRKIRSFADVLSSDYEEKLDHQGRYYLSRMVDASTRMSRLINDILALSRVAFRTHKFAQVDLNDVLQTVLGDLELRIKDTRGTVHTDVLPVIDADQAQMHQLFLNLIGNALKFHRAEEPPRIDITLEEPPDSRQGKEIRINFRDNGIGIESRFLDRIYAPFQRLNPRHAFEGSGIGLAICRRIVEGHGGTISAQSEPGKGSTFQVTLPVLQTIETPTATVS